MMFHVDTAFATEVLALVFGTAFWVALKQWNIQNTFAKVVSVFAIVAAIGGMICTIYWGAQYQSKGYFVHPYGLKTETGGCCGGAQHGKGGSCGDHHER